MTIQPTEARPAPTSRPHALALGGDAATQYAAPVAAVVLDRFEAPRRANPFSGGAIVAFPVGAVRKTVRRDERLSATILSSRPLFYAAGADPANDRPAIVRAGSGIAFLPTSAGVRLAVVQDDVSIIALVDPRDATAEPVYLPRGPGGRRVFDELHGNKNDKLDLEATTVVQVDGKPALLAMGSGSKAGRNSIVLVHPEDGNRVEMFDAQTFYSALRANKAFSGSQLNVEGVTLLPGGVLRIFQRGNGAAADGLSPVDATVDVSLAHLVAHLRDPSLPTPLLDNVRRYDLGTVGNTRITFSDACAVGERCYFLGSAEASESATTDGANLAAMIGVIDARGNARMGALLNADGTPSREKPEGLAVDPEDASRAFAVVDNDDPEKPSTLLELRLDHFA